MTNFSHTVSVDKVQVTAHTNQWSPQTTAQPSWLFVAQSTLAYFPLITIIIIPLFILSSIYSTFTRRAKQMTETNNSNIIKNRVKNPNWPEANQLVIYKRGPGFELWSTMNIYSYRSGWDLNLGPLNWLSSAQTTWPFRLPGWDARSMHGYPQLYVASTH